MNNINKYHWQKEWWIENYWEYARFFLEKKSHDQDNFYLKIKRSKKITEAQEIIFENHIYLRDKWFKNHYFLNKKIDFFTYEKKWWFKKEDLKKIFLEFLEEFSKQEIYFDAFDITQALEWLDKVLFC